MENGSCTCEADPNSSDEGIHVTTIRTVEGIESIRPIWEEMHAQEPYPVVNVDIDRYLSVLKSRDSVLEPYVVLAEEDGRAVGLLVGRIEDHPIPMKFGYKVLFRPRLRSLTVIYGGILGQPSPEVLKAILMELTDALKRRQVDVVFFNHLRADSLMYHICRSETSWLCRGHTTVVEPHWQTRLPEGKDSFFTGKRRRYLKRYLRELENACGSPIEVVCYRSPQDVPRIISEASAIAALTYKSAMNVGFRDDLPTRAILELAAQQNRLRAYMLYARNQPIAFEFGVEYGPVFFPEYIGYDPRLCSCSPGTVLFLKVFKDLMDTTTIRIFDYGFGEAVYKERFGTDFSLEGSVYIFAKRFRPAVVNALRTVIGVSNQLAAATARKLGVVLKAKRWWRGRLSANVSEQQQ
jgi:hypothetical protein